MGAGQSKPPQPATAPNNDAVLSVKSDAHKPTDSSIEIPTTSNANSSSTDGGGCPMKNSDGTYRIMPGFGSLFGRHPPIAKTNNDLETIPVDYSSSATPSEVPHESSTGGCPVKHEGNSSRAFGILRRGGAGPGSDNLKNDSACPVKQEPQKNQQYDVYSRPLPLDPTNNMPIANPRTAATNSLPTPNQTSPLPTERIASTIPKGGAPDGTTWVYPSPQMFYNALARKGKLGDTKEEDMESVVALHNCMNEGTWSKILEWEAVLNPAGEDGEQANTTPMPKLSKFLGRPTDLSPKAFVKHYLFNHPLPFDRHDWTVLRPNGVEVRYVIDYYHDDAQARTDEGSALPDMHDRNAVKSLLVDVRPAADGPSEVWGRLISMPLARRGWNASIGWLGSLVGGSEKSEFEPLPMWPSDSLKEGMNESKEVWANIQRDAAMKKGVGAKDDACASDSLEESDLATNGGGKGEAETDITKEEATALANTFSQILSQCQAQKLELQSCESDEDCKRAFMGMTVCAGQFMCSLQHKSLLESLASNESKIHDTNSSNSADGGLEMAEAKVNMAFEVLGECVSNCDQRASVAKKKFPEIFEDILKKK